MEKYELQLEKEGQGMMEIQETESQWNSAIWKAEMPRSDLWGETLDGCATRYDSQTSKGELSRHCPAARDRSAFPANSTPGDHPQPVSDHLLFGRYLAQSRPPPKTLRGRYCHIQ